MERLAELGGHRVERVGAVEGEYADGGGWGIFLLETVAGSQQVVYYRLSSTGEVLVNGVTALMFMRGRSHDLNVRGAYLHMAAAGVRGVFAYNLVELGTSTTSRLPPRRRARPAR